MTTTNLEETPESTGSDRRKLRNWIRRWLTGFDLHTPICEAFAEGAVIFVISVLLNVTTLCLKKIASVDPWLVEFAHTAHEYTLAFAIAWLSIRLIWIIIRDDVRRIIATLIGMLQAAIEAWEWHEQVETENREEKRATTSQPVKTDGGESKED